MLKMCQILHPIDASVLWVPCLTWPHFVFVCVISLIGCSSHSECSQLLVKTVYEMTCFASNVTLNSTHARSLKLLLNFTLRIPVTKSAACFVLSSVIAIWCMCSIFNTSQSHQCTGNEWRAVHVHACMTITYITVRFGAFQLNEWRMNTACKQNQYYVHEWKQNSWLEGSTHQNWSPVVLIDQTVVSWLLPTHANRIGQRGLHDGSVCLFVCLFVCIITQKRMTLKCSNLP